MTDVIPPPNRSTTSIVAYSTGANRGAEKSQVALETFASSTRPLELTYIDPVPDRAARLAEAGRKRGLRAHGVEARLEDLIMRDGPRPAVNIFQVDRASAIVAGIDHANAFRHAIVGLLLVDAPRIGLIDLRFKAGAEDDEGRARLRAIFVGIAAVSSRDGSGEIFGASAPPERAAIETRMRASFGQYLTDHLGKLASGLEPSGPVIEASLDGGDARPVAIIADDVLDEEPHRVAERVVAERQFTMRRDRAFFCFEVAKFPEPAVRIRSGLVRRDHLLQVGRPRDLALGEADEQARTRLALSRTEPTSTERLDLGAVLGLALASSIAGVATSRFPLTTTD